MRVVHRVSARPGVNPKWALSPPGTPTRPPPQPRSCASRQLRDHSFVDRVELKAVADVTQPESTVKLKDRSLARRALQGQLASRAECVQSLV